MPASKVRPRLEALRRHIETLEKKGTPHASPAPLCAVGPLSLAPGSLHEVRACDWRDAPAAYGLALVMAGKITAKTGKPTVWVGEEQAAYAVGRSYGCGFSFFGVNLSDVIAVCSRNAQETLWAAEEAAAADVGAVLIEFLKPHRLLDLTATRRLQLAAEKSGAAPILLRSDSDAAPSAARTRWRIAAAPSAADIYDLKASGNPRWRIELERRRDGGRGAWVLEWDDETRELREAAFHGRAAPEVVHRPHQETAAVA